MKNHGLATPQVLLPNKKINLKKWAVVACDQYNSNPEYWKRVERLVGNNASTLHIILPEVYLDDSKEERILDITYEMEEYVANGVVEALPLGFVLVQRQLPSGVRTGLVANIDLEKYSFKPTKTTKIRPTEQTVLERIPPRVDIRKPALLESPHILVLLNDPRKKVIEPLVLRAKKFPVLYDFDLMENGGHIKGSFIGEKEEIDEVYERLDLISEDSDILFAVGDGNHSLATAKTVWDEFKKDLSPKMRKNHPKRFALVEVVNLYDDGLIFEPIHRVVFGVETNALIGDLIRVINRKNMDAKVFYKRSTAKHFVNHMGGQTINFTAKDKKGYIQIGKPLHELEAVNFQSALDEYLEIHPEVKVEYIHGSEELNRLCKEPNTTGFVLPKLDKESFIDVLDKHGVLPKKCFSLGEADEKRYYLESRLLDEVVEVDENRHMTIDSEEDNDVKSDKKTAWIERGNNEDVISFAFSQDDEVDLPEVGINEFLDAKLPEPEPAVYLSRREVKRLKLQQRMDALIGEENSSANDLLQEVSEQMLEEVEEPALTRREKRLLKRQQQYEQMLASLEAEADKKKQDSKSPIKTDEALTQDIEDNSTIQEAHGEQADDAPLTRKEQRALKQQKRYEALMQEIGLERTDDELEPVKTTDEDFEKAVVVEKPSENIETQADEVDIKKPKRAKRIPKEIAEAMEEVEQEDVLVSAYALEKARIKLEEEKIRLERYKVREESRLKLQLEREKRKASKRMERDATKKAERNELSELLSERTGSDAVDDKTMRKGVGGVLNKVVNDIKKGEQANKQSETLIVRKGTKEIIGKRNNVSTPEVKLKNKRRRGTIVVKRASNRYEK